MFTLRSTYSMECKLKTEDTKQNAKIPRSNCTYHNNRRDPIFVLMEKPFLLSVRIN